MHQIRYGVDLFVYDLVWLGTAVLLLIVGVLALWATRRQRPAPFSPDDREAAARAA